MCTDSVKNLYIDSPLSFTVGNHSKDLWTKTKCVGKLIFFLSFKTCNPHPIALFTVPPLIFHVAILQECHASQNFSFEYVADESKNRITV